MSAGDWTLLDLGLLYWSYKKGHRCMSGGSGQRAMPLSRTMHNGRQGFRVYVGVMGSACPGKSKAACMGLDT